MLLFSEKAPISFFKGVIKPKYEMHVGMVELVKEGDGELKRVDALRVWVGFCSLLFLVRFLPPAFVPDAPHQHHPPHPQKPNYKIIESMMRLLRGY